MEGAGLEGDARLPVDGVPERQILQLERHAVGRDGGDLHQQTHLVGLSPGDLVAVAGFGRGTGVEAEREAGHSVEDLGSVSESLLEEVLHPGLSAFQD